MGLPKGSGGHSGGHPRGHSGGLLSSPGSLQVPAPLLLPMSCCGDPDPIMARGGRGTSTEPHRWPKVGVGGTPSTAVTVQGGMWLSRPAGCVFWSPPFPICPSSNPSEACGLPSVFYTLIASVSCQGF